MTRISTIVAAVLLGLAGTASAQSAPPEYTPYDGAYDSPYDDAYDDASDDALRPPDSQPMEAPPPVAEMQARAPAGQWIYTQQYGWVWMPYGDQYVQPATADTTASAYVYYPRTGWGWVSTPWVSGGGRRPYFGHHGYAHYRWYPRAWRSEHADRGRGGGGRGYGGGRWYGGTRDHRDHGGWRGGRGRR